MSDFYHCAFCGGLVEAGGESLCTCNDEPEPIDPRDDFFTEHPEDDEPDDTPNYPEDDDPLDYIERI